MTDYMQSLLPELGDYRVASFQQRGVAPSTLSGPFDVPTLRNDVIDVLDTLGWQARDTGLPITRPLYLDYPDLDAAYNQPDEYLY